MNYLIKVRNERTLDHDSVLELSSTRFRKNLLKTFLNCSNSPLGGSDSEQFENNADSPKPSTTRTPANVIMV